MHRNLGSFIDRLRGENEIVEVRVQVDPYLEIAEIHRRVIEQRGKALLFTNVKNSRFPVVTNLFGTSKRIELAFGTRPLQFVKRAVEAAEELLPPRLGKLWEFRDLFRAGARLGTRRVSKAPVQQVQQRSVDLEAIPFLQLWPEDGGHFNTLPLVYTESPSTGKHNLGIYRMQRYDKHSTGMHWQIGKGGGFHYFEAEQRNEELPVNVFLGGPPALMLSAIAPLPEGVPELMLASLLAGEKLAVANTSSENHLRLLAECEFALVGRVPTDERRLEGPFGDHYGYYSLTHDFPVFYANAVFHRKDAIYPATVVGKPKQEDFFLGDYLQELLSPLFPLVMPSVIDLWSYGQTGFHSLTAAVVKERYGRESLSTAFRILGEGQLTLTKFLILTDKPQDLRDFRSLLEYVLARADWTRDLHIFSQTAFDTLDYASGKINHGSKAVLIGTGEAKRELVNEMRGELPHRIRKAHPFCPGCLVVEGPKYEEEKLFAKRVAESDTFSDWQLVVIHDSADIAKDTDNFLWATWTRFDPASDVHAKAIELKSNSLGYRAPIVIDARMKPWYPKEVQAAPETVKMVEQKWKEYFRE